MKKQFLFVANWKMHATFNQSIEFATTHYDKFIELANSSDQKIVLCPSFESLYPLVQMFKSTPISIGAQNSSAHSYGPFTSQVSAQSLQEIGCSYGIIGHSESRTELFETNEAITDKCTHLLDYDITPILCIGETKEEHKKGKTLQVLEKQLESLIETICSKTTVHSYLTPYIAYEPIWSIGTGEVASKDHLETVFCWLNKHITKKCPPVTWKLMYGGSISPQNIANMKQIDLIDGFLIGKASLDFQKFQKIVKLNDVK